jgi:hypothetical protein
MTTETFTAYARVTHYDSKELEALGVRLDHVFVTSSIKNNWNCFGGGIEESRKEYEIATSQGYVDWAQLVYGAEFEVKLGRKPDAYPAAGLTELYNGVCQNVANRILAFTCDNIDVRKAQANALVTLLYGKYGFDIDAFINKVEVTAANLDVSEEVLAAILARLAQGQSAEAELDILKSVYVRKCGKPFPDIPAEKWLRMVEIHSAFQLRRTAEFKKLAQIKPMQDIRMDLVEALKPDLATYYNALEGVVGSEAVLHIMQVLPPNIAAVLKAFDGSR